MNTENPYIIEEYDGNNKFSVVELPESVLGGNDALNFTSALQSLDGSQTKFILVDLKKVKVMNSSGLGMLVGGLRSLQKQDITLVLVAVSGKVKELLELTHLHKVFKQYDNIEDAVNNLE